MSACCGHTYTHHFDSLFPGSGSDRSPASTIIIMLLSSFCITVPDM